ncbi:Acid phosphatase type 7-like [Homarus americanus]|uniref:Acid phosphatase type 7-like n=2 Tax=Homarus americanus TaxID=6706 RepID=A0A8J5MX70_HOMAM|nr:Acid phosphatase type 7-like [Homarus americanus]
MEELLDKYGVDLAVWAHEHSYERLWPMYNFTVMNGSTTEPYTNPMAPVHITTGSAGCDEIHDHFLPAQPSWTAYRSIDYGFTRVKVFNNTHLNWEQVSDDLNGKIIDSVWLVRDRHESYKKLRHEDI